MPELPEVAGLVRFLDAELAGAEIETVSVLAIAALKTVEPRYTELEGRRVQRALRFGKFVALDADGLYLVFHLAKAGWLRFAEGEPGTLPRPGRGPTALRVRLATAGGPAWFDLTEAGTKKRLAIYVVAKPQDVPGIASLGPDPLDPAFGQEEFDQLLTAHHGQIKGLLRNQGIIAGIGNAYSDEILHAARLSPFALANGLKDEERRRLFQSLHEVLGTAIEAAAGKPPNSLKDAKRSGMRVHGRTGESCPVCGDTVREVSFADTSLQYCPTCQTSGRLLADRRTSRFLK